MSISKGRWFSKSIYQDGKNLMTLLACLLLAVGCADNARFSKLASEAVEEAPEVDPLPEPTPGIPTPPPQTTPTPLPSPKPTPPVVVQACPPIQSSEWKSVPVRPFPPFPGDLASDEALEWMRAHKAYGPIKTFGAVIHWAQSYPHGVWPANEYHAPVENGFFIIENAMQMMLDSTTHGNGCHEGCQWDYNPIWEIRGGVEFLQQKNGENFRANLPSGNVFMLRFVTTYTLKGTFAIRSRIKSQTGQWVYTPELKFCIKP